MAAENLRAPNVKKNCKKRTGIGVLGTTSCSLPNSSSIAVKDEKMQFSNYYQESDGRLYKTSRCGDYRIYLSHPDGRRMYEVRAFDDDRQAFKKIGSAHLLRLAREICEAHQDGMFWWPASARVVMTIDSSRSQSSETL